MMGVSGISTAVAKARQDSSFLKKGVTVAILSGISYGFYTAFMTLAMTKGVWSGWYSETTVLSLFVVTYIVATLGSAVNDLMSAAWAFGSALVKGKAGDFFKTVPSKPGLIMVAAALVGGPISSAAYVTALQMAGSIIIPITALCPAIGAILGRVLFKQELNKRMMLGIAICVVASFLIGMNSVTGDAPEGMLAGILIALIAAFGWGAEGCIAGYGTSMIDYEIGITIRQVTSGFGNLLILLPIMCVVGGLSPAYSFGLAAQAFGSTDAMIFFVVSGFFALYAYSLWYKGNSMCGAALGMACNGMFSFWGPFCCWLVLGLVMGQDGWAIPPIAWFAAILMAFGIWVIAMNPLDLFKKKEGAQKMEALRPLNYALLYHFTQVPEACVDDVMQALRPEYGTYKAFQKKSITEAIMTHESNGLISEVRDELVDGELKVYYAASEEQKATIVKYIG